MDKFIIVIIILVGVSIGISTFSYAVSKCGLGTTLLLGDKAFTAALVGMCDQPQGM
jgi:hypothetical protein